VITKPRRQRPRKVRSVSVGAHHFVWFDCLCTEPGSVLESDRAGKWCKDIDAVRLLKAKSYKRCSAIVQREADAIASLDETLSFYSPYTYNFVHLAFPKKKFPTRQAAEEFMARAFQSDDAHAIVRRYLEDCAVSAFEITKDRATRETGVAVTEGESDQALSGFLDYHSG
jgi:hypothetical protein